MAGKFVSMDAQEFADYITERLNVIEDALHQHHIFANFTAQVIHQIDPDTADRMLTALKLRSDERQWKAPILSSIVQMMTALNSPEPPEPSPPLSDPPKIRLVVSKP